MLTIDSLFYIMLKGFKLHVLRDFFTGESLALIFIDK